MDRLLRDHRIWPRGYTYLHVYAVPDLRRDPGLRRLITECQRIMVGYPAIATVPLEWLHITVQRIGGRPATERSADERTALINALDAVAKNLPAINLTAGSALTYEHGVMLDLSPDAAMEQLHQLVRGAIRSVCGAAAVVPNSWPAHLSLGYAKSYQDSDVLQEQLRRVRPSHAPMTLAGLNLVEVSQDLPEHQYRWKLLHRFPLAAPARLVGWPR